MNRNTVRWIVAVLMLLALAFGLSCPSIVEAEGAKLPLDFTVGGSKTDKTDWEYDGKIPVGYKDDRWSFLRKASAKRMSSTRPG